MDVFFNMGILFFYKYLHFAAYIFKINLPETFNWALPLGISFFTFTTMAYVIDVYRGTIAARRNFLDFLLFISFFPHLIAGPILRTNESWETIMRPSKPNWTSFNAGIYLILWGLMKKVLIADNLGSFVETCFQGTATLSSSYMAWLGVYAFAVQIYCDFSGYVDCALGIARIFNIDLPDNFKAPYLSRSITEFWHRWHITLSHWLRDYLYIPLGGNRHGELNTYKNLMLTMILGGLWHGANWTFVVWGFLHGLYLATERFCTKHFSSFSSFRIPAFLQGFITFHLVALAWVYFRAPDLGFANNYVAKLFERLFCFADIQALFMTKASLEVIAIISTGLLVQLTNTKTDLKNKISTLKIEYRLAYLIFGIIALMLFGVHQEMRFIYFDF
jgi:alginate O-acetyltransferase complex protein AlgI